MKIVSTKDLEIISKNFEVLYSQGMNLINIFEILKELPVKKSYKDNFKDLSRHIENGETLSEAFRWYENLYPEFFVEMISIGEQSGNITKVFASLYEYYYKKNKSKEKIISVITYPVVIIIAMIILSSVFIIFIIPSFYDVYISMGIKVPKVVEALCNVVNFAKENKLLTMVSFICWSIIPIMLLFQGLKKGDNKFIYRIKITKIIIEHRILSNILIVIRSGINLSLGLELCLDNLGSKYSKTVIKQVYKEILMGETLTNSLEYIDLFSNYTLGMIRLGEETGTLENRLNMIVEKLENDINKNTDRVINLIQPIVILFLSSVVLLAIVTIVLPMFNGIMEGIG